MILRIAKIKMSIFSVVRAKKKLMEKNKKVFHRVSIKKKRPIVFH